MTLEILGPGCSRCRALEANARAAADKLGLDCRIEHVTDVREFRERGVTFTPALAVDGKVLVSGKVASAEEIASLLARGETSTGQGA